MLRQIFRNSVLIIIAALISCAVNPVTGQKELMLVSETQEISMGREFYPNALWGDVGGGGEYRDDRLKSYLNSIIVDIQGASHRPGLPVEFAIQNSSVPNAWAIPGYVVITRGLLAGLDSEAEFAFVMGHEIGHVAARHSARQMSYGLLQQVGLGVAGAAIGESGYSGIALGVGAIGSSLLLLKYGRDDELEADRLGIIYMARLGYSPQNAVSAHRNLQKISDDYMRAAGQNPEERGFFEDILSTHPRTSVRIQELQHMIDEIRPAGIKGDGTNRDRFRHMSSELRDTNKIYSEYYDRALRSFQKNQTEEADSLISRAIQADSSQPPFHALKGFIRLKKKDYYSAERHFNDALNIQGNYQPAYRGLGMLHYSEKRYSESIRHLKKGISIYPHDLSSQYYLGMSYYMTNNYRTAIPHLKMFAEARPKHAEIHGVLGICYENANDLQSAYNEYVTQVRVAPDNEMGKHAATRIPVLKRALER